MVVDAYYRRQQPRRVISKMSSGGGMVVCCMCGDVGFADKLFRCSRCANRFQHSYCSNYYSSSQGSTQTDVCDWCRYEEMNSTSSSSKQQATAAHTASRRSTDQQHRHQLQVNNRSEYSSGDRVKQQHDHREENKGKQGGVPSPRTATKRYKLLKDVMC
uniref:PHD-type zinc finger plants domain-containing protein n=1 Tax=Kalanchoe fedtschenkoi TaxID=63787 RepID=A0A7N0UZQ0_KALFE